MSDPPPGPDRLLALSVAAVWSCWWGRSAARPLASVLCSIGPVSQGRGRIQRDTCAACARGLCACHSWDSVVAGGVTGRFAEVCRVIFMRLWCQLKTRLAVSRCVLITSQNSCLPICRCACIYKHTHARLKNHQRNHPRTHTHKHTLADSHTAPCA